MLPHHSIYDRLPLSDHRLWSGMVVFTKSCDLALRQAGYLQSSKKKALVSDTSFSFFCLVLMVEVSVDSKQVKLMMFEHMFITIRKSLIILHN